MAAILPCRTKILGKRTLSLQACFNSHQLFIRGKENNMRIDRNLGYILLAVYLILAGLAALGVSFPLANIIMGLCALIAGVLFLIYR
jgi:hypothetical protein